jgi:prepilin-type N-terminal cleavage/methylation domain-containing protein
MTRRGGFTLVELVVVILILGILAGVAAPKMFSTSAKATDNGLKQTLNIVRDAIELYSSQNAGAFPPCTGTGTDFRNALSQYLRGQFPKCPVGPAQNTNVEPVTGATTTGVAVPTNGWRFNTQTGAFICAYQAPTQTDGTVNYDAL